ncbi:hypothetical protein BO94DRAFT_473795 [Aspergillus sclerotioniger CBS 115572]|uniref:Integral membrane protein n=1 Tax=Aspergillus sclerotioniger CBS 115572 TaxID=1450535 RepID=A0A317VT35_9EURO|nr:hypothetical protein BO94DRAFT_473795 [Aspergillus sclerotioniger CBS 115572]PWY75998.1 hypothetical protein BO94DRAFT_473795 [Aspergillus sclerotioniger CBS 115572]
MTTFSPIPAYVLGTLILALGTNAIGRPGPEYPRFGLPFEHAATVPTHANHSPPPGAVSPLMYLKGIRETSYGLALIALQYQGQDTALTTFAAILALTAFADGLLVWRHGGDTLKMKAFGHWLTFVGLAGWSWWRSSYA